jgi:hypothetical protein
MKFLSALALTLLLAACAMGGPIRQSGPNTYQITHTMGTFSPTTGVRSGVIARAEKKCAAQNKTYAKVREEMGTERVLSYILTFQCQPTTKSQ